MYPLTCPPDTFPMTQNANYRAKYLHTNSQCQILRTGPLKHPRMKSQCQILRTGPLKQPQTNSQCQILQISTPSPESGKYAASVVLPNHKFLTKGNKSQ